MNIVEFNQIHRAYQRGIDVLDGVTFSIEPGQVVGLLGKNGAGKTTLIRIAMGMIQAQKGTVRLFGLDPREHPLEVKSRIGYVSEDQILPTFLRVESVLDLHRGLFPSWDESITQRLISRFAIDVRAKVKNLSKGQARQVALLCAICHRPGLLLLDEPAGGLDPATRREFLETSIEMLNEAGTTILFSSHYMSDVERLANKIVMLHKGKVMLDDELDRLQENYCLALIPLDNNLNHENLLALPDCLSVRKRADAYHLIMKTNPDTARKKLESSMSIPHVPCRSIPLEEIFIELAGGKS